MKKLFFSLCLTAISVFYFASPSFAETSYKWSTGVDIPFYYSPKISTGEHGVILKGTQTVGMDKHHKIRYELVKKELWTEKEYDGADIESGQPFSLELHAPQGDGYQIKVNGYSEISRGNFVIIPY